MDTQGYGLAIATRRTALGIKRKDLAVAADISYPYLAQIEAGTRDFSVKVMIRIAAALGWTIADLQSVADQPLGSTVPTPVAPAPISPSSPTIAMLLDEVRSLRALVEELVASR